MLERLTNSPRAAIVLAGGRSTRMGSDKASLPFEGATLLQHVVGRLAPCVSRVIVVVRAAGDYALPGIPVVADLYPDSGPVGGIVTGLRCLEGCACLVVACDMPMLEPALVDALFAACSAPWEAAVPRLSGGPEPLCAVYAAAARAPLQAWFDSGGRSARAALQALNVRYLPEPEIRSYDPELRSFVNLNAPEDLEELRRMRPGA